MFVIGYRGSAALGLAHHPVVGAVVRNLKDFIGEVLSLSLARLRVLGREVLALSQPLQNRGLTRQTV